ncbi:MAG TPA: BON domain-containing protein [Phenylobacterium sp.]|jgi:osmotically-inducible protein OsmY
MPDNRMDDDRERSYGERNRRGFSDGRDRGEDRSWNQDDRPDMYGARRSGSDRDRVFGEGETGASYGGRGAYRGGEGQRGWQQRNYGGVSPAMRQGEYGGGRPRFSSQDYTTGGYDEDFRGGGRFYGDDERERIYREEYGQGGVEYGDVPRGYDAQSSSRYAEQYSPTRERYHAQGYGRSGYGGGYSGDLRQDMRRPASGGTGGYDYERGYGDGGRGNGRGERTERFEQTGRNAGDFLHRAGEKVAAWFGGGGEARAYDRNDDREENRGARGLGPKGYKRSDDRISDDAHERLTDDTWLDASNISISVSGGEVTLSGTVDNREAKHRAERIVEEISGVNHVQNNLRLAKTNIFTSDSTGYGDSVAEAQMRRDDPVANGTGGEGAGQSTAGKKT